MAGHHNLTTSLAVADRKLDAILRETRRNPAENPTDRTSIVHRSTRALRDMRHPRAVVLVPALLLHPNDRPPWPPPRAALVRDLISQIVRLPEGAQREAIADALFVVRREWAWRQGLGS